MLIYVFNYSIHIHHHKHFLDFKLRTFSFIVILIQTARRGMNGVDVTRENCYIGSSSQIKSK